MLIVARELVEPGDDQGRLAEPVAGTGGLQAVVGQDLEGQVEAPVELILPLLGQAAGADDEAALEVSPGDELLDQQAGHDRLARAGVVGQKEAQGLAGEHLLVDGGNLVGQRLHDGRVDGQQGVKEGRQTDAMRLGDQAGQ